MRYWNEEWIIWRKKKKLRTCKRANSSWISWGVLWNLFLKKLRASEQYLSWSAERDKFLGESAAEMTKRFRTASSLLEREIVVLPADEAAMADLRWDRERLEMRFPSCNLSTPVVVGILTYWIGFEETLCIGGSFGCVGFGWLLFGICFESGWLQSFLVNGKPWLLII